MRPPALSLSPTHLCLYPWIYIPVQVSVHEPISTAAPGAASPWRPYPCRKSPQITANLNLIAGLLTLFADGLKSIAVTVDSDSTEVTQLSIPVTSTFTSFQGSEVTVEVLTTPLPLHVTIDKLPPSCKLTLDQVIGQLRQSEL